MRRPPRWPGLVLPALNLLYTYASVSNLDYNWLGRPSTNEPIWWPLGEVLIEIALLASFAGYIVWIVAWGVAHASAKWKISGPR